MTDVENQDMATMPVRELIVEIRERAKQLPPGQMVVTLVLNVLARRLEQEADRADRHDEALAAEYNRRVPVEQFLLDVARGKNAPPDAEKCRELARQLAVD